MCSGGNRNLSQGNWLYLHTASDFNECFWKGIVKIFKLLDDASVSSYREKTLSLYLRFQIKVPHGVWESML